jgi:hypothetical protein
MTEHEYEVYRKTHGYAHPLDIEQGKILREKADYAGQPPTSKRSVDPPLTKPHQYGIIKVPIWSD